MVESMQLLSPQGRVVIQPGFGTIVNCAMGLERPIDPDCVRAQLTNSWLPLEHPRFRSLVVRDSWGREQWIPTQVDVDRHLIVHQDRLTEDPYPSGEEDAVNDYVADLCYSSPLPMDKPLWEVHLLVAHKTVVLRMHHALGDGTCLMSILLSCSSKQPIATSSAPITRRRNHHDAWTLMKVVWYTNSPFN